MDDANLVRMANRIGDFFAGLDDATEAREGIAQHLARYWAPVMRRELLAVAERDASGLDPLVREALTTHRERLLPAAPAR